MLLAVVLVPLAVTLYITSIYNNLLWLEYISRVLPILSLSLVFIIQDGFVRELMKDKKDKAICKS